MHIQLGTMFGQSLLQINVGLQAAFALGQYVQRIDNLT